MVINYLDIKGIAVSPDKADAILIVDADAVLSFTISLQSFEVITRKDRKIAQQVGGVQLHEFPLSDPRDLLKASRALPFK